MKEARHKRQTVHDFIFIESRVGDSPGAGGDGSNCLIGTGVLVWDERNVLEMDAGDGCMTL